MKMTAKMMIIRGNKLFRVCSSQILAKSKSTSQKTRNTDRDTSEVVAVVFGDSPPPPTPTRVFFVISEIPRDIEKTNPNL